MKKGILFVFSGPSGSGKTTLAKEVVNEINNINFAISYTTRQKRDSEVDGKDYHFVNIQEFNEMIKNKKFAEWAEVFGNYYGTPLLEVNKAINNGSDVLLEIDVKGAKKIRNKFNDSIHVFIIAPDMKELRQRLEKRKTDSSDEIVKRLNIADKEITEVENYDYIIINEDLNQSFEEIRSIIETERSKIQ
ncbi:MAG: guanylate kinase [Thermodesulfobacteriota bacterium]